MTDIAQARLPALRWGPGEIAIAALGITWIALAAFWAAPGVFMIDGYIDLAMIDAFAHHASFFVQNGMETYGNAALVLPELRAAGEHLAPQYPGGWGILAAPAYIAGGLRGVMLMNAAAAALTLPLTWITAQALFEDRQLATRSALIYGICTFAVEYAVGFWPHAVDTFLVTAAATAVAKGWRSDAEMRGALVAGLLLGLAINIRIDALIFSVPLVVWLLGVARRPHRAAALLLAGLVPGLIAATVINEMKFGIPSPLTYDSAGGATSLGFYAGLAPLAVMGALGAFALGRPAVRVALYRPSGLATATLTLLALGLLLPDVRNALLRLAQGFWLLVVDFQSYRPGARGATVLPDGTLRMFGGLTQKSLLESLPYAAALLVLIPGLWRGRSRAALGFCFTFVGLGIVPFAYGSWQGGMASNMRYFLNFLPALAILAAAALDHLRGLAGGSPVPALGALLVTVGGAVLYALWHGYPIDFLLQHTLPTALMIGLAGSTLLLWLTREAAQKAVAKAMLGLFLLGLGNGAIVGWAMDLNMSQQIRARNVKIFSRADELPRNALVVTMAPVMTGFTINRPPALTAYVDVRNQKISADLARLVRQCLAEKRPVYVEGPRLAAEMVARGLATGATPIWGVGGNLDLYRVAPPAAAAGTRP